MCRILSTGYEALHRAHALKPKAVIHRDVKPDNIFIHHPSFGEPVVARRHRYKRGVSPLAHG